MTTRFMVTLVLQPLSQADRCLLHPSSLDVDPDTQNSPCAGQGRSGGSAKVKVKRREPEFRSADMLQSFSYVCRMFYFGSSHLFQHDFCENEPNTNENETDVFVALKPQMQTVQSFCRVVRV